MVLFEMGIHDFLLDEIDVFFVGPYEVDGFEVHEFFSDVLYLLYEIDIVFVEFGLGVDDGDDARGF